jgi:GNAT superfamily N-acetyltransferase
MVTIRAARAADAAVIATIRAQSWQAAYQGLIPAPQLARATGPGSVLRHSEAIRRELWTGMVIAAAGTGGADSGATVIGFASFGPERGPDGQRGPAPGPGHERARAELYAIYVIPEYWSTGAGRALMDAALRRAATVGYGSVSLWVLRDNRRARRFYERAGFTLTGDSDVLDDLGSVTEVRYEMRLG